VCVLPRAGARVRIWNGFLGWRRTRQ
jgi:hypothetical protein